MEECREEDDDEGVFGAGEVVAAGGGVLGSCS